MSARIDDRGRQARWPRRASTGRKSAGAGQERVDDRFVLFRLARAGGIDSRPPGATARGVAKHLELGAPPAPAGRPRCRRHWMSGSRRSVPRPEQGASTNTQSKARDEGQRLQQIGLHEADVRRRRWPRPSAAADPCADRGRRTRPEARVRACPPRAPWSCRLAMRRCRARARRGRRRRAASTSCDASSCTTNQPASSPSPRRGCPSVDDQRVGREPARAWTTTSSCRSRSINSCGVLRSAVGAKRQRRRRVVEPQPGLGRRRSRRRS